MAENYSRTLKKISERQQKQLILMMRSYSPPGHPRSGPSIEYSEAFWENVKQTLNLLESDPRQWRDKAKWRSVWRYYTARVKGKLNKSIKMTSFETQVANFLQNNSLEESNVQVEEEDEDSVENIQVQPDINETLPEEPVVAPVRAQPIQRRRKTVGFVVKANIDQASQHSQDTYVEPKHAASNHNTNATQTQTHQIQTKVTDYAQPSTLSNDQRKSNSETSISMQTTSTPRNARIQRPLTQIKTESDELDQPSTSTNQNIKSEPGTLQASPSPSTSRQNANSATNHRKRKRDEDNSVNDKLTRQLAVLIKSGKRMAKMASELRFYFQTVSSIAETFQEMREQRRQESFANTNGFRTENNMTTNTSSVPQVEETFANTNGLRTESMTTNTPSVPQNPSSHENGAQERSDDEDTVILGYEERNVIDLTD